MYIYILKLPYYLPRAEVKERKRVLFPRMPGRVIICGQQLFEFRFTKSQTIHVWYVYLHLR